MGVTHFSFHSAECMTSPLNFSKPGISGHAGSLRLPRARTNTFASSSNVSPVSNLRTDSSLVTVQHP